MGFTNAEKNSYTKQHLKGFETIKIWPLNPNIMQGKMHLSKFFLNVQEPINIKLRFDEA
jgi:hypothetical protein